LYNKKHKQVFKKGGGMRKGFTLLELLIVIIIVGVMATLGLTQYTAVVERSRGAEARQILGQLRSICAALYMDQNSVSGCTANSGADLGLGDGTNKTIPSTACYPSHYFRYTYPTVTLPDVIVFQATRCTAGGKTPQGPAAGRVLNLSVDFSNGNVTWQSPYGY
jgi:prepilin-type N-terminal cleavage/methylation domain-containing protein